MNVQITKIISHETPIISKAIELLPSFKQEIAYALFFFWKNLNPFVIWNAKKEERRFIVQSWKELILTGQKPSKQYNEIFSIYEVFGHYQKYININYLVDILNAIESCNYKMSFDKYADLDILLKKIGSSIALISLNVLFHDEVKENKINNPLIIKELGKYIFLREILINTSFLADREKFFIPREDLEYFNSRKEDIITRIKDERMREITFFQLNKLKEYFHRIRKLSYLEPNPLFIQGIIDFLTEQYIMEIEFLLKSKWLLTSEDLPRYQPKEKTFQVSKLTNLFFNAKAPKLKG